MHNHQRLQAKKLHQHLSANTVELDETKRDTPVSDFFPLPTTQPRPFVSIPVPAKYGYTFFQTYYQTTGASPTGPDDDDEADQ